MAGMVDVDVEVVPCRQLAHDLALVCDLITGQSDGLGSVFCLALR